MGQSEIQAVLKLVLTQPIGGVLAFVPRIRHSHQVHREITRTNPLSKAKEMEKRVARIVTAYLEGISSSTTKRSGLTCSTFVSGLNRYLLTGWGGGVDRS